MYRLRLHPWLETAFHLDQATSALVRRIDLFAIEVLAYWGFVHFYERRTTRELAPRLGWVLVGALTGAVSIGLTIVALYATGHYEITGFRGLGQAGGVLGVLWVAAVLEEIAFRGIVFRMLEEAIGTRAAVIASSVVFTVAHLENNGVGWAGVLSITLAGLMWAGVFILSRNIWVTAAHHFSWNSMIFLIGVPLSGETDVRSSAPLETVTHGSALWTGGAFGPENSLINIAVSTAICLGLWWLVKRQDRSR